MSPENQNPTVFSVSELTTRIQNLLEDHFDFIWVEGEISNFSAPVSGHYYLVLKDEKAQVRAVMFRFKARHLKFLPENGMKVIAQGRIGVYAPRGEYQVVIDYLEPLGVGALAMAFEQLKKKLAAQGIFDASVKKPLPFLPQKLAVITSPTGAAIRDFLKIINRRFLNLEIIIVPVKVQGEEAAADMIEAIDLVNRELQADVIVLTRGGGSLEDLWAFNNEGLAIAIRRSNIPVVSAVGHEIDLTISDLAADFRAPTPSAAAEILVAEKDSLVNRLNETANRLVLATRRVMDNQKRDLLVLIKGLRDPRKRLMDNWLHLAEIHGRLVNLVKLVVRHRRLRLSTEARALLLHSPMAIVSATGQRLAFRKASLFKAMGRLRRDKRHDLTLLDKRLKDLSPLAVLERGYSITLKLPEEKVLRDAEGVETGQQVSVVLARGGLKCRVEKVAPKGNP